MKNKTLVIDSAWRPINIVDSRNAFKKIFKNKAEIVMNYDNKTIATSSLSFGIPSIIRLTNHIHKHHFCLQLSKKNLMIRDESSCQYCGIHVSKHSATIDHVIPKSNGGSTSWNNVVIACGKCNQKKGNKSLLEFGRSLKKNPKALTISLFLKSLIANNVPAEWKEWI